LPIAAALAGARRKINFSQPFAGKALGIAEVHDDIWTMRSH